MELRLCWDDVYKEGGLVPGSYQLCVFGRSLRFTESPFTKNAAKITHISSDCFEDPVRSGRWSLAVTVSNYNSKLSAKYHVSGSWRSELGTVPAVGKFKVVGSVPPEAKWSVNAEGSSRASQEADLQNQKQGQLNQKRSTSEGQKENVKAKE